MVLLLRFRPPQRATGQLIFLSSPSPSQNPTRRRIHQQQSEPWEDSPEVHSWLPFLHHHPDNRNDPDDHRDTYSASRHLWQQVRKHGFSSSYPSIEASDDELLQTLCKTGHVDKALDVLSRLDTTPSTKTYLSLLKACSKSKARAQARKVCSHLVLHRAPLTGFLGNYLVITLAKCGAIEDARHVLHALPHRTASSWTAIISAYVERGSGMDALKMYQCMQQDWVDPDNYTFVSLLKACGSIPDLTQGRNLHAHARAKGFASDVFVCNTLVSMYGKCGAVLEAEDVFAGLSQRNVVSWNAMLSAYVEQGQGRKALLLYRQMQEEGTNPDQLTILITLQACGIFAEKEEARIVKGELIKVVSLEMGQAFHKDACKKSYTSDILVGNTLVSMYGKCGAIAEAELVFNGLSMRDIVSWNAMLSAYGEQGQVEKALTLYRKMQEESISPDQYSLVFALQACGTFAQKEVLIKEGGSAQVISFEIGHALHADAQWKNLASDVFVGTALVSMYGKCGVVKEAEGVFAALSKRNIVSWTAMLSAYVEHGQGEKALLLYRQMQKECLTMDDVTFICILQASSETGSLEICKQLHCNMVCAGYEGVPSAAATLIHAYVNCASMLDAQAVFDQLPEPHLASWTASMAGYAGDGNFIASLCMFETLQPADFEPNGVAFISVLSAFSHTGLVVEGLECFQSMSRDYGIAPDLKHYGIMIDLLGRAGDFKRLENMLGRMQMQADPTICMCLLHACLVHGNLELAKQVFDHTVRLQPKHAAAYILMSNIYADAGLLECAAKVEKSRQELVEVESAWGINRNLL